MAADEHACAHYHVDLAHKIVFRLGGVVALAEGQSPAVAQHDAAGFLHGAVAVEQLGADHADAGVGLGERRPSGASQPAWTVVSLLRNSR